MFLSSRRKVIGQEREQATRIYDAAYDEINLPAELAAGAMWSLRVRVQNQSSWIWRRHGPESKNVDLTVWIDGQIAVTQSLPVEEVHPGERVDFRVPFQIPGTVGPHEIVIDMIEQNVALFKDKGSAPLNVRINVFAAPVTQGAALQEKANRLCPWNYQPSAGIQAGADGAHYPLFIARSKGAHFWDTEDRQYIDYVMGWGCALLGYAEPRVQEAVRRALESGAVVPLPHALEVEVAEMLTEDIPCAERVVFGKNGSDACTVAARLARAYTGRNVILYSGYHGWQDWWVEQVGFENCGVPDRATPMIHRFKFNNQADFQQLFELYKHDLAAIMLEPSGPAEGPQGSPQDADPAFLLLLADSAKRAGALLIYDEIMTGFRYPGGSVQKATGVIPDLTCLGKALGGGMPLSALAGRAAIMESAMHRTHYGPTFKGEIYSLAAAKVALGIYRSEPVAEHVLAHGNKLREGVNRLSSELGVNAQCVGPAFRATVVFSDNDVSLVRLKRTLYFQELLKRGIMTYNGFMLPSYAHDDQMLNQLLECAGSAFECVARAERNGTLDRAIEIPLL
jgi:glutamate-1-semialdehyde aminotransferase